MIDLGFLTASVLSVLVLVWAFPKIDRWYNAYLDAQELAEKQKERKKDD